MAMCQMCERTIRNKELLMKVKQAKLASALRGETSNIIEATKYELLFDKGMLHAKLKLNPKNIGPFVIFPANIAYLEYEETAAPTGQESVSPVEAPKPKTSKK